MLQLGRTFTKEVKVMKREYKIKGFNYIQRLAIDIRDGGCQFPDCNNKRESIHHIVPRSYAYYVLKWKIVDINKITNGISLCRKHHDLIHEGFRNKNPPWNAEWDEYFKKIVKINGVRHNLESIYV